MWNKRSLAKVVEKSLRIELSCFILQLQCLFMQKFFRRVESRIEDCQLWPPPGKHHIHEGQDARESLSPILGNETSVCIWYLDERKVTVRKARLKPLDTTCWIHRLCGCMLIQTRCYGTASQPLILSL